MKFGLFYEQQLPRPWTEDSEHRVYQEALREIELADDVGVDYAWAVEHHFLEEYSHCSAPEVFLAAAAARTEDIRLGHGVRLTPHPYNPTPRLAEQVATLDLVSDGRVEYGAGESGSTVELDGFDVPVEEKYEMWLEGFRESVRMMTSEPYPGCDGDYLEMPARNVVPKPLQNPHPPLWMACSSREMIQEAARHGVGALCFAFRTPEEAGEWVDSYLETFKEECVPVGESVNPRIAMATGFSCHSDHDTAVERAKGFDFFRWALAYYYVFGSHAPGFDSLWKQYQEGPDELPNVAATAIGTPEELLETCHEYEDVGVDQLLLVGQGGDVEHSHVCSSIELFADEVMPELHEGEEERRRQRMQDLQPYIEEAFERREQQEDRADLEESDVEDVEPYDRDYSKYL